MVYENIIDLIYFLFRVRIREPTLDNILFQIIFPLFVSWYAFYLLLQRIFRVRWSGANVILSLIFSLFMLRLGVWSFWIGILGIFYFKLSGALDKLLGILIVALIYTQAKNILSVTGLFTILALFGILVVLMKVRSTLWKIVFILIILTGYLYFAPIFSAIELLQIR